MKILLFIIIILYLLIIIIVIIIIIIYHLLLLLFIIYLFPEYGEHICFLLQQQECPLFPFKNWDFRQKASGPRAAKTACVTSLVRVGHSKDGILKQWESELDSSSDILQCLNAVSSYKDYWIFCICLHIKTRL